MRTLGPSQEKTSLFPVKVSLLDSCTLDHTVQKTLLGHLRFGLKSNTGAKMHKIVFFRAQFVAF